MCPRETDRKEERGERMYSTALTARRLIQIHPFGPIIFPQKRAPGLAVARGQTMVLGALLLLFACFVLFSTLGIAWKCKERIRLQSASDASAYSQAIRVARAFNYFAFTNRALASNLVSLTTLHAYHSELSAARGLYLNLALAYQAITAEEIALTTCVMGVGPCQFGCFAHAIEDEATAIAIALKNSEFEDDIKELDTSFARAVQGYEASIHLIQLSQQAVQLELEGAALGGILSDLGAAKALSLGRSLDEVLQPYNFPSGTNASGALDALNLNNLREAMDFSDSDEARIEMTEVANAARPLWVRNRLIGGNSAALSPLFSRLREDSDGMWLASQIPVIQGASGINEKKPSAFPMPSRAESKTKGEGIGSVDYWEMTGMCEHNHAAGAFIQPFPLGPLAPGLIYSSAEQDEHNLHDADVDHRLDVKALLRFMRFNVASDGRYNQPVIYKSLGQDISLDERGKRMPWDIFDSGRFTANLLGTKDKIDVQLSTAEESRSLSKAIAYYHHPGNWREPPNFWNPFWRAKLHPFSKQEWVQVGALSGQPEAAVPFAALALLLDSGEQSMEGT